MSMNTKQGYEQIGVAVTCRGFEEYARMFGADLRGPAAGRVLDIAGGASSFTADAEAAGIDAYAADPRYALESEALVREAEGEIAVSAAKLEKLRDRYDFSYYGSLDRHRAGREASLRRFAAHYGDPVKRAERYAAASLPRLPYADGRFDLVLCSHFLFLYEDQFDERFHREAVLEMMRVCKRGGAVRIYPIVSLRWTPYAHMDALLDAVREAGGTPGFYASELPFIPGSELGLFVNL
ncbi:methyltransferase domain-containing protein [Paenibacillus sp. MWE-103]|uniref:Methyltransferase domain-containing protein n=2 Tax=Paenibacillus artemisiicola TaxID=1172618 RepID=A0ABS3WJJ3_9BACL|nr:methyltransferase domain-containing protein [Paenibacillus artemisiicola]